MRDLILSAFVGCIVATAANAAEAGPGRRPSDEIIYFVLPDRFENGDPANDRGGLHGDRLEHGFDPTDKGFYHGGDLAGLTARLDYIQSLGATAIWLTPVFKNKPVQCGGCQSGASTSAGYHGYWITDFTHVDPHLGDAAQMHALVRAVHARGMKIYLDIITNHTADVIAYRECPAGECAYRSRADYPYQRRGGVQGEPINSGFAGVGPAQQTTRNFAKLTRPDFAYTPYVPPGEARVKVPAWLNDPIYYNNRGNTTFVGENVEPGDFAGLDDLMTENPRVVAGMIEIYGEWIERYRPDGFRVDTAKHVNVEFWQAFVPAMLQRASAQGIDNFHIFAEVATSDIDTALLARYTKAARFPAVLDFAFANAVRATVAADAGTDKLARLFADDALYEGGEQAAFELPTFVSNHDSGRFASHVRSARPHASDAEVLKRVLLAHAMMFTLRGVPVVYYGDEQGFAGAGGDKDARHDMMPSRTAEYLADRRIGVQGNPASFDLHHPIARAIAGLSALRGGHPALRSGRQVVRSYADSPGLFAVSRFDPVSGHEVLIAFNTSTQPLRAAVQVDAASRRFSALHGQCEGAATPGSYLVALPPLDFIVCSARETQ